MADDNKCKANAGPLLATTGDTILVAVRVAGKTIAESPATLKAVATDPKVVDAIKAALREAAQELATAQRKDPNAPADGGAVLKKVGDKVLDVAPGVAWDKVKDSPAAAPLKEQLDKLKCAYEQSPLGVFIGEHMGHWYVYVAAAGVAVGGLVALYATGTGDAVTEPLAKLASKALKFKVVGDLEVGATGLTFKPAAKAAGGTLFVTDKWKKADIKLELSVLFEGGELKQAGATGTTVLHLNPRVDLTATAAGGVGRTPAGPLAGTGKAGLALQYTGSGDDRGLTIKLFLNGDLPAGGKPSMTGGGAVGYSPPKVPGLNFGLSGQSTVGGDHPDHRVQVVGTFEF